MRKYVHWIALIGILGTLFLLLEGIWIFAPLKQRLRQTLIQKVEQITGETVFFQDFSLSPVSVSFKNIEISSQNGRFAFHLDRLEIRLNILKFVQNEFNPIGAVTGIRLKGPQLRLQAAPQNAAETSRMNPQRFASMLQKLQKLPNISFLEVEDGSVILLEGRTRQVPLLQQLTGTLQSRNSGYLWFNLKGALLDEPQSAVRLIGNLHIPDTRVNAQLHFENSRLNNNLPLLNHPFFTLTNAVLNGVVTIDFSLDDPEQLALNGTLKTRSIQGSVFNQRIAADSATLVFSGDTLTLLPIQGTVEDGKAVFSGTIAPLTHPQVNWKLRVTGYSLKYLQRSHAIFEYLKEGQADGEATFTGPLRNLTIRARATAPSLLYAVVPFQNNQVELVYQNKQLEFPALQADFKQFRTQGKGIVDFQNNHLSFTLHSFVHVPDGLFHILDRLNRKTVDVRWNFAGDFIAKTFDGTYRLNIADTSATVLQLNGRLRLEDQHLTAVGRSPNVGDSLQTFVEVKQLFSNPTFRILDVKNFPLRQLTSSEVIKKWARPYKINAYLAGPYTLLTTSVLAYRKGDGEKVAQLNGYLKNVFQEEQKFNTRFWLATAPVQIRGKARLSLTPTGVSARVELPELLTGDLFYSSQDSNRIQGNLVLNNIEVGNYVKKNPQLSRLLQEGKITGHIRVSGTLDNPQLNLDLNARDFIINGVGYYATRIAGSLQNGLFRSKAFWIQLNNAPVAQATFTYHIFNDSLQLAVNGKQVESNFLVETIAGKRVPVRGTFDYTLNAVGPLKHPVIYGDVQIHNGKFEDKHFDLITLIFSDSIAAPGSYLQREAHRITVQKFLYVNKEEYSIEGEGTLGLGDGAPLDVRLSVNGNVLLELSRVLPFFQKPRSNGVFNIHITGSLGAPEIRSARLKIFNGSLAFEEVLPPLTLLQADLVLPEGSRFVEIRQFDAWFGKRHARLSNLPQLTLGEKPMEPLVIEPLNLSLGILQLETDPGGIQLSIPGLMVEGDYGFFEARGKTPGERFTIAGPLESPYVRGTVVMYNARVTYPFLATETSEDNPVVEYLSNVYWDIRALSGKGNRYFVDIPAIVDKVSLDLAIDNQVSVLEFKGRLSDNSFRVVGQVESTNGRVEYLDTRFNVEKFGAEFHEFELYPEVYGRAYTTVRDSANAFPEDIYLVLYAIDPATGKEVSRANWENLRFKLVSQNPELGETQESVLAKLGYSPADLTQKAEKVGLRITENLLIRPLVRPIERTLEQTLRLDYVRLRSNLTGNLYYMTLGRTPYLSTQRPFTGQPLSQGIDPVLLLLQSSELTVGKYLWRNFYVSYSGQLVIPFYRDRFGFNHRFGLEYRIKRNLLLEVQYDKYLISPYYFQPGLLQDFSIRLRHSIKF